MSNNARGNEPNTDLYKDKQLLITRETTCSHISIACGIERLDGNL